MAEVDTSSYPKAVAPPNPLDVAHKLGTIQQQSLGIDKAKLDQANQGLQYLTRAFSMVGPDATKEQYLKIGQDIVKMGLVKPEMLNTYAERLNAAPTPRAFYDEIMTSAASHQEMINWHLGPNGLADTGQTITPIRTPGKTGIPIATDRPWQKQIPPTTPVVTPENQPALLGAQPPDIAPGSGAVPGPRLPTAAPSQGAPAAPQSRLPVAVPQVPPMVTPSRAQAAPAGVPVDPAGAPVPRGPVTGPPAMFTEGKAAYTADQDVSTQRLTALKPVLKAFPMIEGLRTGPTTEGFNKIVATLKANHIIPTSANDPTAIYQEVNKYLSQYLKGRGGRSDADLAAAEKSSPNVGVQLNPALLNLTRSAIAQDRLEALRAPAFEGKDYSKYGAHKALFPATIDEKALALDTMPKEERKALIADMQAKGQTLDGQKFWRGIQLAIKHKLYDKALLED